MNIPELREKIVRLEQKRRELKEAVALRDSVDGPTMPENGYSISIIGVYMSCPQPTLSRLCTDHVNSLRNLCKILAKELGIEHEELPLDE